MCFNQQSVPFFYPYSPLPRRAPVDVTPEIPSPAGFPIVPGDGPPL